MTTGSVRAVTFAGPGRVVLEVDAAEVACGEHVTGSLRIEPLSWHRAFRSVRLGLALARLPAPPIRNWQYVRLDPGEEGVFPFSFLIPWRAPLGSVAARVKGAVQTSETCDWAEIVLYVHPPALCRLTAALLEEVSGLRVDGWQRTSQNEGLQATLRRVPGDVAPLSEVQIELFPRPGQPVGQLYGSLILCGRRPTRRELLQSTRTRSPLRVPIVIDPHDPDSVRRLFRQHITAYLHNAGALPLPSTAPALLRPDLPLAAVPPPVERADLPRPEFAYPEEEEETHGEVESSAVATYTEWGRVVLTADQLEAELEGSVTGTVRIEAVPWERAIPALSLWFRNGHMQAEWPTTILPAGEASVRPYSATVPWGASLGDGGALLILAAGAGGNWTGEMLPMIAELPIYAHPPAHFRAVAALVAEMAGLAVESWTPIAGPSWAPLVAGRGGGLRAMLRPYPGCEPLFEEIQIELIPASGMLFGEVLLVPRRGTSGKNILTRPLLPRGRRLPIEIDPTDPEEAARLLERLLRAFIDQTRLPLPAAAPPPSALSLPLAAAPPQEREDLPRPSGAHSEPEPEPDGSPEVLP
jgi:hypothetical protein